MASQRKDPGIQRKLVTAFESVKNVLEERNIMNQLKSIADTELKSTMTQILDLPDDHPEWGHNIAVLIGTARAHRAYSEIFHIKEK